MSALKGDFISFSFNGVHSSELGIIRTSDGSRFNENLLPTIQDKTVQVPGGDGTYFFGSYYTQRPFNVPIAFDSLTEEQVRRLYSHFGDKQIHELIFDERPYKYYMAKITGTPQIKTICFEVEGQRIYKGEGTLNFVCYYPFAKSRFKYLGDFSNLKIKVKENDEDKEYTYTNFYNNLEEWAGMSKMKPNKGELDVFSSDSYSPSVALFNAGDFPTDFCLIYKKEEIQNLTEINLGDKLLQFDFSKIDDFGSMDSFIQINSSSQLIEGLELIKEDNFKLTGKVYNVAITDGEFFQIPLGDSTLTSIGARPEKIEYRYVYI